MSLNVEKSNVIVHGLQGKIKTIYNTPDVNFKFISFPIKYNLIIHPILGKKPTAVNQTENLKYLNKNTQIISEFSYLEIFIYFIFIVSYLSLLIFFLYNIY